MSSLSLVKKWRRELLIITITRFVGSRQCTCIITIASISTRVFALTCRPDVCCDQASVEANLILWSGACFPLGRLSWGLVAPDGDGSCPTCWEPAGRTGWDFGARPVRLGFSDPPTSRGYLPRLGRTSSLPPACYACQRLPAPVPLALGAPLLSSPVPAAAPTGRSGCRLRSRS